MTTTFSEDTDITNADPHALALLPTPDSGSFDRVRVLAHAEILRRLARREPPVTEGDLSDTTELTECEVRFALHYIYKDASSRKNDNDRLWGMAVYYLDRAEAEINDVRLTIGDETVQSVQGYSAPIFRS